MYGLRPAVVGLIGAAVISVGQTVFFGQSGLHDAVLNFSMVASAAIFALMIVLALKNMHPILIIALSAVLGIAVGYAPSVF